MESDVSLVRQIKTKLFTHEDKGNFHKTLGIACLLSYIYRFAQVGERDMGFGITRGTLGVIFMHLTLSVSSLIFRIPMKRIAGGYRIWPEYRLHSIVFACRSLACMLLTWLEGHYGWAPEYRWNAAIVLATNAAADLSSMSVGAAQSNSIRDLDAGPATRFFFSAMQFHATMGCMLGTRRFSTQFIYVWIIQFNAFLMTIRRKNLAPQGALVTIYGLMLVFGFIIASYEAHRVGAYCMVNAIANFAALARLGLRAPKYPMWIGFAILTHFSRDTIEHFGGTHVGAVPWPAVYAVSVTLLLGLGYHKITNARDRAAAEAENGADAKVKAG